MIYGLFITAYRTLLRNKSYAAINIFGLSVSIACVIIIFLFVKFHLSADRFHEKAADIFRIVTNLHLDDGSLENDTGTPYEMAEALKSNYPQVIEAATIIRDRPLTITVEVTDRGEVHRYLEQKGISFAEPSYFKIFNYTWVSGDPDAALNTPNSVALSQKWAEKYFGESDPIGRTLIAENQHVLQVRGVIADYPPNTDFKVDMFISLPTFKVMNPKSPTDDWTWINSYVQTFVLLEDPELADRLDEMMGALSEKHFGEFSRYFDFHAQPLSDIHFNPNYNGSVGYDIVYALIVIGIFLVSIAAINYVNLAIAKAISRAQEIGVRKVLGCDKKQLIAMLLTETFLICLTAASLGTLLAYSLLPIINGWIYQDLALNVFEDHGLVAFLITTTLVVTVLAGFYPALVLTNVAPIKALKGHIRVGNLSGFSMRKGLIVFQLIVVQGLITGAVVVSRQTEFLSQSDLGFNQAGVLMVNIPKKDTHRMEALSNRIKAIPGVSNISFCFRGPSSTNEHGGSFRYDGQEWESYPIRSRIGDHNYLKTFGLALVAGRDLQPSDTIKEFLVNEEMTRRLGLKDPHLILGKSLFPGEYGVDGPIVGVVKDFYLKSLHAPIEPAMIATNASRYTHAGIKIAGENLLQTLKKVQSEWEEVYPKYVFQAGFLDDEINRFYQFEVTTMRLIRFFALMAILIGCFGLYGLASNLAAVRTKEIGIRKVLGASVLNILTLFSRDFAFMCLIAVLIASPLAGYYLNLWIQDYAYRIDIDTSIFVESALATAFVVMIAIAYQSIHTAFRNPVESLRYE